MPEMRSAMLGKTVGEFPVMACPKCSGLFIHHETFEMMQDNTQRVIEATDGQVRHVAVPEKTVHYLRCPVCRQVMNRKNFAGRVRRDHRHMQGPRNLVRPGRTGRRNDLHQSRRH